MRIAWILAVVAAVLLVSSTRSQEKAASAGKGSVGESAKKVKDLQAERVVTLEKMVDVLMALFQQKRGQYDDVLDGQRQLIEAKLDAAETDKERVGLRERLVEVLKQRESNAEELAQAGRELQSNVLKARARRLEAEIHLEQAKMKLAEQAK
jgi:hypothetical protein